MPSNGKVLGKLVAQLDLQTGGFMKSTTGVNKAIRQVRSNLKTLDKFYKASGDEMGRLNSKLDQSKVLMDQYKEKVKQLKTELNDLKPNTQAFVKQQNQIRRTEADMKQLEAEMKSYRKQMLYVSTDLDKVNSKYKSQKTALEAIKNMYSATGNKVKEFNTEQKLIKANIDRNNNALKYEREILERVRKELGFTSSEYKEQTAKIRTLKAENTRLSESYKQVGREAKIASLNQQSMNTRMGRAAQTMKQNKAGLIDIRNSLMGLTAAAVGVAYPMARAMGGAVRATVQWEDALSNVAKTTNASQKEMNGYSDSIRQMAKQMPESQSEIANTMALAAQLGIKGGKDLKDFTKIATQMGVATDMSAEQASEAMAKFANATGKPDSDFRRLGSTVVNLGNNMAAQESNIMEFAKRLAGTGTVVGVSQKDILALSSAMASVGISAEAGGSALSKVLTKMNNAVQDGGKELQGFASIAGKSGQEFADIWKKDPYEALQLFEKGLADQNEQGKNVKEMLKDLGITEIRETDTVLRLANGNEQLRKAREHANKGYKEGNALSKEAETKYKTLGNQMKIFMNHVRDLGISLGEVLAPMLIAVMKALTPMIDALAHAPKPVKAFVVALALIPVAAVPVLGTLAAITGAMGLVGQSMLTAEKAAKSSAKGMGVYRNAMLMLTNPVQGTKKALTSLPGLFGRTGKGILKTIKPTRLLGLGVRGLSTAFKFLTGPIGLALTAITLLWKGFKYAYDHVKWFRDGINGLGTTIKTFAGGIAGVGIKAVKGIGNAFKTTGGWIKDHFIKQYKASEEQVKNSNDIFSATARQTEKEFKGIFNTLSKANKKATDTTKVLGKGVSEGTKKALSKFVDYSKQSDKILAKVKQSHGKITKEETNKLLEIQQDSTDNLLNEFHKRAKKQSEIQQEVFKKNSGLTAKQEQAIMERTQNQFKESEKNLRQINNRIQELVQKNARDGKLSGKEMEELNKLYDKQRELAVGTLSQTHKEQERILSRMSANRKAYSMKEAQSIVKESIKARDTAKKENKKAYDQEIDHINSMVGLSKEEKEKMLENAQDRYDKANKKADDAHKKTLDGLKKSNKNIENEMDLSNGKMYTKAEQWWNNFTDAFLGYFKDLWTSFKKNWTDMIDDIASIDWSGIWDGIKNTGSDIGGWFSDKGRGFASNFKQGWNDAIKLGGSIWSWITNTGAGIGTWFANKGHEWYNNFITKWNETKNTMGDLWSGIKEKGSSMGSWFSQKGQSWYSGFKNKWEETRIASGDLWAGIKNTGSNIGSWFAQKGSLFWTSVKTNWDNAMLVTGGLWNSLVTFLSNSFGTVKRFFSGLGSKMWTVLKAGWNLIVNSQAGQLFTSLIAKLGAAWGSVKSWFYSKGAQMLTAVVSGWKSLASTATAVFTVLWQSAKNIWAKIWGTIKHFSTLSFNWVRGKWLDIKNATSKFFTSAWTIVKNIWKGITGTIKYWTGLIWNRIKSVFTWIRDRIKSSFTAAWNIAKKIWKGIYETIKHWTQVIWDRIKAVFGWIKKHIKNAFSSVWSNTKKVWKNISNTIKYWTNAIWNRIKSIYNKIKNYIKDTLKSIWTTTKKIWKGIKGTIAYWTQSIYNKIKSIYRNIRNYIKDILNKIWSITKSVWKGIKNTTSYWVKSIYDKVKSVFSSMRKNLTDVMNKIKSMFKNAWRSVKSNTIDLVVGMWNKVRGVFNTMKNGVKSFAGTIKKHINGMVSGIKGGLNNLIKAVNWVGSRLGVDKKIPKLSTGTESTHTQSFITNGAINRPTLATVNDKGKGNGTGRNGHQELIQRKNGSVYAPQGRDIVVPLEKGDKVINGKSTQKLQKKGIIPRFSRGTDSGEEVRKRMLKQARKAKRKRKHQHPTFDAGEMMAGAGGAGGAFKEAWNYVADKTKNIGKGSKKTVKSLSAGAKKMVNTSKEALGAAGTWAKEKAGDLLDFVSKPGKLVDKVLQEFGVDFGNVNGEIPKMLWNAMWKQLKESVKTLFGRWLDDAAEGDGDGRFIKYLNNITTPYSPNGPPKGYPFNWAHPGVDLPYRYEKVQTPLEGKVETRQTRSGFGHHIVVKSKPYDAYFGHLSKWLVKNGQHVKPGDTIAISGGDPRKEPTKAGSSTGSHLHYEMNKHGFASMTGHSIDPVKWLKSHNGSKGGTSKKASAWRGDIERAAKRMKVNPTKSQIDGIIAQIQRESGGDAGITQGNIGDINNLRGTPAQGLLQYVPSTFRSYAVKGHNNIKSGYDQLLAFFNNSNWKNDIQYGRSGWGPRGRRRFAHGGLIKKHGLYEAGEGNRAEMVLPLTNKTRTMQLIDQAKRIAGIKDPEIDKEVNINSTVSTTDLSVLEQLLTRVITNQEVTLTLLTKLLESSKVIEDKETGILEGTLERLHNKHQDKRERKESRISKYNRGGSK